MYVYPVLFNPSKERMGIQKTAMSVMRKKGVAMGLTDWAIYSDPSLDIRRVNDVVELPLDLPDSVFWLYRS